ncbi:ABC transporter ATP-binding protein [Desulfosporosinus youngiae]|uniref:ABC-type multidrug transport system, ATPase and permease component n=1 Tax=Desulfosporosinus youngiae DSM 17734 TaxID=768710 RepID=H5Y654_9FIRM|nr:ABC transporter ATP-binding protein [Desulfosporosinus youngiae]EHQ91064.1 ABC-type multidrug transport system, ATPase and permease component [Desulfosporosinus youngiae DSM 17734]
MNTKTLTKQIKSKNKALDIYMFVSVLSGIATTFLVVWLVNLFISGQVSLQKIAMVGAGICISQTVKAIFYAIGIGRAHDAAYRSLAEIRLDIVSHLKKLPLSFFQKRKTGDLTNIINHDVEQIEIYLAHAQPEIKITLLLPLLAAVSMLVIDWRLALALITPFPVMAIYQKFIYKLWGKTLKRYIQSTKEMSEDLIEYIGAMPAVKAFSTDEQKTGKVLSRMQAYITWVKKIMYTISVPLSIVQMLLEIGLILVVIVGAGLMINGQLSIIRFILALILSNLFSAALIKYMSFHHSDIMLNKSAESIVTILGEEPRPDYSHDKELRPGDIELRNVTFSYDEKNKALKEVNLTFRQNTISAIVGSSGSGKSTIANLIMGFWQAEQGTITIGGKRIDKMNERDLSSLVSIVQQESFLFNATIAENILIGSGEATREEVVEAAQKARIHEMISNLPKGYDTMAGEGGAKLSGGEKQRIAIARIILKNAPIIILDEATAAIDPYNEHLIQEAISNLSKSKTLIVIAHHLNTIVNADQIVVMDQGCMAASGKHSKLLDTCPLYSDMVKAQNEVDHWEIKQTKEVSA